MDATWVIPAFVVMDTLVERLGQRTPRTPPRAGGLKTLEELPHALRTPACGGGDWGGAQVPDFKILTMAVIAADEQ